MENIKMKCQTRVHSDFLPQCGVSPECGFQLNREHLGQYLHAPSRVIVLSYLETDINDGASGCDHKDKAEDEKTDFFIAVPVELMGMEGRRARDGCWVGIFMAQEWVCFRRNRLWQEP